MIPALVIGLLSSGCQIKAAQGSGIVSAVTDVSPAPATPEEVSARIEQLRAHYQPYLRSLPKPLEMRARVDLSGTWRSKFELKLAMDSQRPPTPDWWREDFDDSGWENVTVPEWRYGMLNGNAAAGCILWYRTTFASARPPSDQRTFLVFAGVDWEAEVWLNGTFLGRHNVYYEPFRFDVTSLLKEKNVLAVRVFGGPQFGAPIFGFSVLPNVPAEKTRYVRDCSQSVPGHKTGMLKTNAGDGYGIHREVFLETTGAACVSEVFVRGDVRSGEAKLVMETDSPTDKDLVFEVQILPENFKGKSFRRTVASRVPRGTGRQTVTLATPNTRLWQPTDPCLYRCRVILRDGGRMMDAKDVIFGFRSFALVTAENPRPGLPEGMFLLNDRPVFLRGTNVSPSLNALEYWHQRDKLLDALLMAKAANFNAVRACEFVLFPEVRELLDRLGMMSEQDQAGGHNTPNSGFSSGNTPEDVAALTPIATTLARVCYNNPGVVLLSLATETFFDPRAIIDAVRAVDLDRILVPISGHMRDWGTAYERAPGYPSLPKEYWNNVVDDFHCYNGAYLDKAKIWKFSKRRQPARLVTVGEFGVEALDAYATMQHYPSHLQPPPITADVLWGQVQVRKADECQIVGFRGQRPSNLGQYIEASQNYQADVLAELATGFRLSPRCIGGYFMFHFIDALPAHWPKSIVSHDLRPKKGYFEMAQVNQPVVPLFQIIGQGKSLEIWLANDIPSALINGRLAWTIKAKGKTLLQGEKQAEAPPLNAALIETVDLSAIPQDVPIVTISLTLTDATGKSLARYQREVFLKAWRLEDALF